MIHSYSSVARFKMTITMTKTMSNNENITALQHKIGSEHRQRLRLYQLMQCRLVFAKNDAIRRIDCPAAGPYLLNPLASWPAILDGINYLSPADLLRRANATELWRLDSEIMPISMSVGVRRPALLLVDDKKRTCTSNLQSVIVTRNRRYDVVHVGLASKPAQIHTGL